MSIFHNPSSPMAAESGGTAAQRQSTHEAA
jgi:hypothetical protein